MPQSSSTQALLVQTQAQMQQLLEDPGMSPALRRSMWLIVLLVLAFLLWAVFAPVNELARARGEVIPSGYVQVVQSQAGGVIEQLLVREGDTVKAGQLMARFKAVDVKKRAAQANIRLNSLAIDRERCWPYWKVGGLIFRYTKSTIRSWCGKHKVVIVSTRLCLMPR